MDWVIQKATELGVSGIMPLQSRHSIVKLRADRVDNQLARWQRIALEAAQQSEQWRVPTIAQPQSLSTLLTSRASSTVTLMLAERRDGESLQIVTLRQDSDWLRAALDRTGGWLE